MYSCESCYILVWELLNIYCYVGTFVLPLVWEILYLANVGTSMGELNWGEYFPLMLGIPCRSVDVGLF